MTMLEEMLAATAHHETITIRERIDEGIAIETGAITAGDHGLHMIDGVETMRQTHIPPVATIVQESEKIATAVKVREMTVVGIVTEVAMIEARQEEM